MSTPPIIALVTARAARDLDEDLPPLHAALRDLSVDVRVLDWDDRGADWSRIDMAVLRSTWDYTERLPEFLEWAQRASTQTRLLNPLPVVCWNTDKHYLDTLSRGGVRTVPSEFLEPGMEPAAALGGFLERHAGTPEFVVKPSVGAGSRDAQRYARNDREAATAHAKRLLAAGRSVLLQPYLERVDEDGETALMYFCGRFSHAIRKGPLLRRGADPTRALFAPEHIAQRVPTPDQLQLAEHALASLPFGPLLYARIDTIRDGDGAPCILELELTEPSLFFAHASGSAARFATAVLQSARPCSPRVP